MLIESIYQCAVRYGDLEFGVYLAFIFKHFNVSEALHICICMQCLILDIRYMWQQIGQMDSSS